MKALGVLLIVLGVLGLAVGGVRVFYPKEVADIGPLEVNVTKHKDIPLPPILGVVALVVGAGIVMSDRRTA